MEHRWLVLCMTVTLLYDLGVFGGACNEGWSSWINHNNPHYPSNSTGDHEQMTAIERINICLNGNLTQVECVTVDLNIPSYSSGEFLTCSVETGLVCNHADNFPVPCSDFKARFFCNCPTLHNNDTIQLEFANSTEIYNDTIQREFANSTEIYIIVIPSVVAGLVFVFLIITVGYCCVKSPRHLCCKKTKVEDRMAA